jgi:hypothetical protein
MSKDNIPADFYTGVLPNSGALYTPLAPFSASASAKTPSTVTKKAEPTTVKLKTSDTETAKEIKFASWGTDNKKPNQIIADIEQTPSAARALEKRVESTYSLGPFLYELDYDENNKEVIKPITKATNENVFNFLKKIRFEKFMQEMLFDIEGLRNVFPEFILNKEFDKIVSVRHVEAKHCRWSVRENGDSFSKYCGISSEWGTDESVTEDNCTVVLVADPWMTVEELKEWVKTKKVGKFIFPVSVSSLGKTYYQSAPHESSRNAGWVEIAKLIPSAIIATLKNAKRLQWHVKIPYEYWEKEFPKQNYIENPEQRIIDMNQVKTDLDNFLSGADNAGKSFYSHYGKDPITNKEYPGWVFEKLDNNPKFDKEVIATSTADSQILMSWGVDPSVVGVNQLGQNNGAGSGSDKREADLIFKGNNIVCHAIGEPLEKAIEFNGWGDNIKLGFKKEILTTLDKNPTGSQKQTT